MEPDGEVTLSALLKRSLEEASDLAEGATSTNEQQTQLEGTLGNLQLCARLIDHLALLSPNETLEDLSSGTLRCLLVPYWQGILIAQLHCPGTKLRQQRLADAQTRLEQFQRVVDQYDIFDKSSLPRQTADPAARRMAKIAAYKLERELQGKLKALQERRGQVTVNSSSEEDEDETLRPLMLAQIQFYYIRAVAELSSIAQELELLHHAIPTSELPREDADQRQARTAEDNTWRLDQSTSRKPSWFDSAQGPVVDTQGKILRPFTITGSTSSQNALGTRLALQDGVFGPGHRLPTMSIDEFLDEEYARGNVLQGGEADAQRQEAESQRRKQLVEMDNLEGYEESDRRLAEARRQDEWRDTNRRGDGNRIGRG